MVRALFSSRGALSGAQPDSLVGLTDLQVYQNGGEATLFATTRGDGWLSAYDIGASPGQTRLEAQWRLAPGLLQLETTDLVLRDTGGTPQLFLAGLNASALTGVRVDLDGSGNPFSGSATASASGWDMGLLTEMELFGNGAQGIAALRSGGLVNMSFGSGNTLSVSNISQSGALRSEQAADIVSTTLNGNTYAFVSYGRADTISMFRLENGTMRNMANVDAADGLWVEGPGAMAVTSDANGTPYLIVAASGSSSLSVLEIGANGQDLTPVDHLVDDRSTRFSDVSRVTSVTVDGQSFVVAAGNDQGISLFTILPGGRLQHVAAMAADATSPLRGITALEAIATSNGIRVWVSTYSAPYLTEFFLSLIHI